MISPIELSTSFTEPVYAGSLFVSNRVILFLCVIFFYKDEKAFNILPCVLVRKLGSYCTPFMTQFDLSAETESASIGVKNSS